MYAVNNKLFIAPKYSGEPGRIIVITKVGRKYAYGVFEHYFGTDDEKEMTFQINIETNTINDGYRKKIYASEKDYLNILNKQNDRAKKIDQLRNIQTSNLNDDQIDRILEILNE